MSSALKQAISPVLHDTFPGDSRMAQAMRAHDWANTALGTPDTWPEGLKVPLRMMLTSRFEMWLGWGSDVAFFYNDAYLPTLGAKHPNALGRPTAEVWHEIYADVKGRIDTVMHDGKATWDKALLLVLQRNGYAEETYHTFSYSPLRGDDGGVGGLMCIVTEETERVISERRLETLRTLATELLPARGRDAVVDAAHRALASNPFDFPFGFVRLFDPQAAANALATPLHHADWRLDAVVHGRASLQLPVPPIAGAVPCGAWTIPPRDALVVAIARPSGDRPFGALVLGLNPYRPADGDIEGFAHLVAGQIAAALATVEAGQAEAAEMERLRQLFEQSPSFMAILRGPEHRFELVNPTYAQLVAHRDVVGMGARDAIADLVPPDFFARLDRVLATGEAVFAHAQPVQLHRVPGSGSGSGSAPEQRLLDFVYQPIRADSGAVTGIFVEGIDVTSAQDALLALRESEAQFRTFAQAMPNHVWTAPPHGGLDWFNEQTFAYTGLDHDSLCGSGWTVVIHPDDLDRAADAWATAVRDASLYETEFRIRRADGAYRWHLVRALPIRDDAGVLLRWIGTNTDIHAQKQAEATSAAERERIWTSTNDLMAIADLDLRLKSVNPAWRALLGFDDDEIIGRSFFSLTDMSPDAPVVADLQKRLAAGHAVRDQESRLAHKDGGASLVAWSGEPFGAGLYIVARNVTEQRAAEDALRQSQKMEAVGQLTGGIAHDFNNLLQGITGSLDLMQKRISQGRVSDLDRFITGAMASAKRASALTHRLLAFSRRQPLAPRPVRANPLIASMEDLLRRTLGERIELELALSGGLWLTMCDPNQLENAVLNLAINARDAMPDGGRLTIETGNAHLDSAYAARQREVRPGQYVCISVSDTGTGMDAQTIARAFEPFFTTKPIGQGTGLGLSMIYGFARQSDGYSKIYSEVGRGTTFKLYLPRTRATPDDDATPAGLTHAQASEAGETVLVVEDEPVVRGLIVEILGDLGYNPIEAADGPQGLELLQSRRRIDLLITDMGLPGLNGRQIADAGRALRPGLKVLFMTGYAENAALAAGFLEPGMAMITKPFAMEGLATRVRTMIEDASASF